MFKNLKLIFYLTLNYENFSSTRLSTRNFSSCINLVIPGYKKMKKKFTRDPTKKTMRNNNDVRVVNIFYICKKNYQSQLSTAFGKYVALVKNYLYHNKTPAHPSVSFRNTNLRI